MNDDCVEDLIGFTKSTAASSEQPCAEPGSDTSADISSPRAFPPDSLAIAPVMHLAAGVYDQPQAASARPSSRAPVHAHPFSATALMLRRRSAASTRTTRGRA